MSERAVMSTQAHPLEVRKIGISDLRIALEKGAADFAAVPTYAIFVALIYPVIGLLLFRATFHYNLIPLIFPLIAGFALLGPFAAIGLYHLSKLREQGRDVSWRDSLGILKSAAIWRILVLGLALTALFLAWIGAAYGIYQFFMGDLVPVSIGELSKQVLLTPQGQMLILVGNLVGLGFALAAFVVSVVSFPLLVDRDVSVATAVTTSIKVVLSNPVVMVQWGMFVAATLAVAAIPALLGLVVALPVLGHATWHLYRRVVL